VGQDEAVQTLVDLYQVFGAGLHSPGRPFANLLFLGPTGSGKTRIVEAAAEILFGNSRAVVKVDCDDFYEGGRHEMLNEVNRGEVRANHLVWLFTVLRDQSQPIEALCP